MINSRLTCLQISCKFVAEALILGWLASGWRRCTASWRRRPGGCWAGRRARRWRPGTGRPGEPRTLSSARIRHLEQLAADGGRQEADLQASNTALRAELAEASQRREELEQRAVHILREVAVLEAPLAAASGEVARLGGGGRTRDSQVS